MFENGDCLLASDFGEAVEELIKAEAILKVVEQRIDWASRPDEARLTAEAFGVSPNGK